jgi:hypothetical protein
MSYSLLQVFGRWHVIAKSSEVANRADIHKGIPLTISYRTVKTGTLLIAQIHGYLLGLKSIKTFDSGSSKNFNLLAIISTILIINLH